MKLGNHIIICLLMVAGISSVFAPSMSKQHGISRFDLIEKLDVLYNRKLNGESITVSQDPSVCLQQLPRLCFIQNSLIAGNSPIWNPLAGCGQPLIADPANGIWNPVDLIIPASDQLVYNYGVLLKIVLSGICTYFFCVARGAAPWAAATAATGFALCPQNLRSAELPTMFVPLVFLVFQVYFPGASAMRTLLCALGIALSYSLLHPEIFFIAIISASTLWLLEECTFGTKTTGRKGGFVPALFSLVILGALSVSFVAPFLFPFLEYLCFAHSYKYGAVSIEYIRLLQLPIYLCVPQVSNAICPGIAVLVGLPSGIWCAIKKNKSALLVVFALILFACRPAPLDLLFNCAPFSFVLPNYAFCSIILLLCSIGSIGLSEISKLKSLKLRIPVAALSALLAVLPTICLRKLGTFESIVVSGLGSNSILFFCLFAFAIAILISTAENFSSKHHEFSNQGFSSRIASLAVVLLLLIPAINIVSMAKAARNELPSTKLLAIPPASRKELLSCMQNYAHSRFAACGSGVLVPGTGLFYGLRDFRTCSPLNDRKYMQFAEAMGAKLGYCNMIQLPDVLGKMIDVAAIEILISATPVSSQIQDSKLESSIAPDNSSLSPKSLSGRVIPGLRLIESQLNYYPTAAELSAEFSFRAHENLGHRYRGRLLVLDEQKQLAWQSSMFDLLGSQTKAKQHATNVHLSIPLPTNRPRETFDLVLKIFDSWTGELLAADGEMFSASEKGINLASIVLQSVKSVSSLDGRFSLVHESSDLLRVYKNNNPCPRAYLAERIVPVATPEQALKALNSRDFVCGKDAVVESSANFLTLPAIEKKDSSNELKFIKDANTEVALDCRTAKPSFLVLSDLYYPGWNCYVDGQKRDILRTNFLFRGVKVRAGRHSVLFRYEPISFYSGSILSVVALGVCVISILRERSFRASGRLELSKPV